jgi:hypothetical protein
VVLWQKFGGSILGIFGVIRIGRLDATVHRCSPVRTGRTVHRLCADGPRGPGGNICDYWLYGLGFNSTNNCSILLILIQIHG